MGRLTCPRPECPSSEPVPVLHLQLRSSASHSTWTAYLQRENQHTATSFLINHSSLKPRVAAGELPPEVRSHDSCCKQRLTPRIPCFCTAVFFNRFFKNAVLNKIPDASGMTGKSCLKGHPHKPGPLAVSSSESKVAPRVWLLLGDVPGSDLVLWPPHPQAWSQDSPRQVVVFTCLPSASTGSAISELGSGWPHFSDPLRGRSTLLEL